VNRLDVGMQVARFGAEKISEGGAAGWDDKMFFLTTAAD